MVNEPKRWMGVLIELIRRITGHFGTPDRSSDAKKAEEADRVKHDLNVELWRNNDGWK